VPLSELPSTVRVMPIEAIGNRFCVGSCAGIAPMTVSAFPVMPPGLGGNGTVVLVSGVIVAPSLPNVYTQPPVSVRASSPRVIQLPPSTQDPPEHRCPTVQNTLSGRAWLASPHTGLPVEHPSVPVWQGLAGTQAAPCWQSTHAPFPS